MGILKRLADANEPEGGDEEPEWRVPGSQSMCGNLTGCTEDEHGAQIEVLADVSVEEGGRQPSDEVGAVSGME